MREKASDPEKRRRRRRFIETDVVANGPLYFVAAVDGKHDIHWSPVITNQSGRVLNSLPFNPGTFASILRLIPASKIVITGADFGLTGFAITGLLCANKAKVYVESNESKKRKSFAAAIITFL